MFLIDYVVRLMFVPYFDTITGCEITNVVKLRHDVLYSSRVTLLGLAELMCFFRLLPHFNKLCELQRGESNLSANLNT